MPLSIVSEQKCLAAAVKRSMVGGIATLGGECRRSRLYGHRQDGQSGYTCSATVLLELLELRGLNATIS